MWGNTRGSSIRVRSGAVPLTRNLLPMRPKMDTWRVRLIRRPFLDPDTKSIGKPQVKMSSIYVFSTDHRTWECHQPSHDLQRGLFPQQTTAPNLQSWGDRSPRPTPASLAAVVAWKLNRIVSRTELRFTELFATRHGGLARFKLCP